MPQFQAANKSGKKGWKGVGRKAEPLPLVGMLNENSGTYDRPVVADRQKSLTVVMVKVEWCASRGDLR